jgi:hypothetical protein
MHTSVKARKEKEESEKKKKKEKKGGKDQVLEKDKACDDIRDKDMNEAACRVC